MKNPFSKKAPSQQEGFLRTYLDRIAPGIVKFEVDHYIFGSTYRCVWALREYPASTEAQALLRELGEKSGVTLRIYCRQVSPGEEDRIIDNANKKNKLDGSDPNKLRQAVAAESNLRDVAELVHKMHREHEPLVHCAVYLELTADSKERLRQLQTDVLTELVRCKLNVDKLLLRQKQGFCCVSPVGSNVLGREFERVLPASSAANLYPFNYSGKTDPNGFYIGKDKYGSNIVVDFDRRDSDKTSANILILGNSGQGKSYLIKLLICNLLEAGKAVIQETRRWDDNKESSHAMRSKEDAKDYRYFPDPDLPPIHISDEWIAKIRSELPEFREEKAARYQSEFGLPEYDSQILTESRHLAALFEDVATLSGNPKKAANWFMVEVLRLMKEKGIEAEKLRFTPQHLADLLTMVDKKEVSPQNAKKVFEKVFDEDVDPVAYVEEHGLKIVEDTGLLSSTISRILDENPGPLSELLGGKEKVMGFFVGQIMKEMKGKANPASVREALLAEVEKRK